MNTWGYFKRLEQNAVQGDQNEGLQAIFQVSRGTQLQVEVAGQYEPITGLFGQIHISRGDLEKHNLFCMFALTDDSFSFLDDSRFADFGDTAVLMTHGDEFLARLRGKLDCEKIPHKSELVLYVDQESHHGEMGPFRKLHPYHYQSEFRLLAHADRGGPLRIEIGDISDISIACPINELKSRLRLIN